MKLSPLFAWKSYKQYWMGCAPPPPSTAALVRYVEARLALTC